MTTNRPACWLPSLTRRTLLGMLLLGGGAAFWRPGWAARRITVSLAQLQQAIAPRFPHRQRLAEVLEVAVAMPRLTLLPEANRLGTELEVAVLDRLLGGRYSGVINLDYGLRFDPLLHAIRMTGVRVGRVHFADVPEPYQSLLGRQAPRLGEQLLHDAVLHQFTEQDLSLLNGLGLEPGEIKVTSVGLSVTLRPRPLGGR